MLKKLREMDRLERHDFRQALTAVLRSALPADAGYAVIVTSGGTDPETGHGFGLVLTDDDNRQDPATLRRFADSLEGG